MVDHLSVNASSINLYSPNSQSAYSLTKPVSFIDPIWQEPFDLIQQYLVPGEQLLLPDEFCHLFENGYSYSFSEEIQCFNWVLIHKGRISELRLKFLYHLYKTHTLVLANEVFVLFSTSRAIPQAAFHRDHVQALLIQVWQLQLRRLSSQLSNPQTKLIIQRIRYPGKPSLLIEHKPRSSQIGQSQDSPYIPLSWAATSTHQPYANLGDALSPILVSALSGLPAIHRNFESHQRRLACVGTIAHGFKNGIVHLWGTGIDHKKNPADPSLGAYSRPPNTRLHPHAVRGRMTARILRQQGLDLPDIYGDPVWFLPAIIQPAPVKQYELGIIVHLSELTELSDSATVKPDLLRYQIPTGLSSSIRIITTITQPSFTALEARVQEITACKRIVSTSLHGLVIAEAYGIPCASLRTLRGGATFVHLDDLSQRIDWRIRDFYSGMGVQNLFLYGQQRCKPTDWEDVIQAIDSYWQPVSWSPKKFLDAFPIPLAFNPLRGEQFSNYALLQQIKL